MPTDAPKTQPQASHEATAAILAALRAAGAEVVQVFFPSRDWYLSLPIPNARVTRGGRTFMIEIRAEHGPGESTPGRPAVVTTPTEALALLDEVAP